MGCCCSIFPNPDGRMGDCYPVNGPENCPETFNYHSGNCGLLNGGCFFVGELSNHILDATKDPILTKATHPAFRVLYDFRDVILRRSEIGREVLSLYHSEGQRLLNLLKQHPELLRRTLKVLVDATFLVQDTLRAQRFTSSEVACGMLTVEGKMVKEFRDLLHDIAETIPKEGFDHIFHRVGEIIDTIEGMTTRDILYWLDIENPRGPKSFLEIIKMEIYKGYFWYYMAAIITALVVGLIL